MLLKVKKPGLKTCRLLPKLTILFSTGVLLLVFIFPNFLWAKVDLVQVVDNFLALCLDLVCIVLQHLTIVIYQ